jgi:hypothetical protein
MRDSTRNMRAACTALHALIALIAWPAATVLRGGLEGCAIASLGIYSSSSVAVKFSIVIDLCRPAARERCAILTTVHNQQH